MAEAERENRNYRFGEFVVNESRGALQQNGRDVPLRPKSWRVLHRLVRQAGELVSKEALLEAAWHNRVVSVGVVAKSVQEIRLAIGDEAHTIVRTVPRRGYIFDAPVTVETIADEGHDDPASSPTVPDALAIPGGAEPLPTDPHGPPITSSAPLTRRNWRLGAAVTMALAAVALVWSMATRDVDSTLREAPANPMPRLERSIAVLPFEDMSPEGDEQYLADGMAEEILNLLATSEELTVIARTSSFALRDESIDAVTLGRRLNAAYLLEGSLRRAGDDLRIGVQLVDGHDGTRVWSASYDRRVGDALELQSEIADAVSDQLHVRLTDPGERQRVDPVAYQRYMEARFLFNRRLEDDLLRAEQLFLEATRIDPDFARAWAGLAGVYAVRTQPGLDDSIRLTVPESLEAMAMPIERALQAEPDLAEAHVRASIYYWRIGDSARARDHLARAQALAPNDPLVLASFTWTDGESEPSEEQVSAYRKIIAVDPLSLLPRYNLVNALTHGRHLPEARREIEAALSLFPEASAEFATPLAMIELLDGNSEAAAAALRAVPDATDRLRQKTALLAMAWHGMGLTDRSVDARTTLERAPDEWAALRVAEINAYTGDSEEAFAWLREATHRAAKDTDHRDFWLDVQDSMFLNELKGDPRWRSLKQEYLAPPQ